MSKVKAIPKFIKEITITVILLVALCILLAFVIKGSVVISDQGLSTFGLALSTSVGVLTAIVVSFVLIIWAWSRQQRSTGFWRFRDALHQLSDCFDANLEVFPEIAEDIIQLTFEAAAASLLSPMPHDRFKELSNKVCSKVTEVAKGLQGIKNPSSEQVAKARACRDIGNHLVVLATANFEHRIGHDAYKQILRLQGLLYRLFAVLTISIVTVAISVTTASKGIPDVFNIPLVTVLIGWFVYLLVVLGREMKGIVRLEELFRREVL